MSKTPERVTANIPVECSIRSRLAWDLQEACNTDSKTLAYLKLKKFQEIKFVDVRSSWTSTVFQNSHRSRILSVIVYSI